MNAFLRAVWDGFKLRCPGCRQGAILKNRREINLDCPACGTLLYRSGEADWLIVWLSAYTVASIVLIGLIVVFQLYSKLDIWTQIGISSLCSALVLAIGYPNFKGAAVGVLHFMRNRWRE